MFIYCLFFIICCGGESHQIDIKKANTPVLASWDQTIQVLTVINK
jgi:hypothetical protein